jgi:hypothetical protein
VVLGRFKISIYKNLLDYFISFNIDSKGIAIDVSDKLGIGLILEGFFRDLSRGLRSGRVFGVVRILRSIVSSFWYLLKIITEVLIT